MSAYLTTLRERRDRLVQNAQTVMGAATAEKRDLTTEEERILRDTKYDIDGLDRVIHDAEARYAKAEMSGAAQIARDLSAAGIGNPGSEDRAEALAAELRDLDGSAMVTQERADYIWSAALAKTFLNDLPRRIYTTEDTSLVVPKALTTGTSYWTSAGGAITPTAATYSPITITPQKLAYLQVHNSETEADAKSGVWRDHLANVFAGFGRAVEAGFVTGNGTPPNPNGLVSMSTPLTAGAATAPVGLDHYQDAYSVAVTNSVEPAAWLIPAARYADLLAMTKSTTDLTPLLVEGLTGVSGKPAVSIMGIPVLFSATLTGYTGWLIGQDAITEVRRASVEAFRDPYSLAASDRIQIRLTSRINWAFDEDRIVEVTLGTA